MVHDPEGNNTLVCNAVTVFVFRYFCESYRCWNLMIADIFFAEPNIIAYSL